MIRAATLADAGGIARVHTQAWAETYAEIAPPAVLSRWTVADRTARWQRIVSGDPPDPHRAEVAVLELWGGAIAGFASWGEQRDDGLQAQGYTGEVSAIYLLRAVQGRGHGRALMIRAARGLLARGHRGASVWAIRENRPARAFYERLGGIPCGEQDDTLAGHPVVDVGYGWPSLDALAEPAPPYSAACTIGVGSSQ